MPLRIILKFVLCPRFVLFSVGSDKAQYYTLNQAKALAMTALDIMCNPGLVNDMKQELQQSLHNA